MHDAYRERETVLAMTMADRADWEHATRQQRQLAVAADAELRRRHPAQPWPPLRSAEPEPSHASRPTARPPPPTADISDRQPSRISDLAARHREFADKLAERQSLMIPAEDPDYEDLGPAFPAWTAPARDAILQPPQAQIQPLGADTGTDRRPRPRQGSRQTDQRLNSAHEHFWLHASEGDGIAGTWREISACMVFFSKSDEQGGGAEEAVRCGSPYGNVIHLLPVAFLSGLAAAFARVTAARRTSWFAD